MVIVCSGDGACKRSRLMGRKGVGVRRLYGEERDGKVVKEDWLLAGCRRSFDEVGARTGVVRSRRRE